MLSRKNQKTNKMVLTPMKIQVENGSFFKKNTNFRKKKGTNCVTYSFLLYEAKELKSRIQGLK